jgi:Cytochrome P450
MLGLMTNPNAYRKLLLDIDNAAQAQKIPPVNGGVISDAQAKELPYLQAVIKEVLSA